MPDAGRLSQIFADALLSLRPARPLLLAVSGGGDSMALLHLAAGWAAEKSGRRLHVATVDHGLREDAGAEAHFVARVAKGLGADHRTLLWAGQPGANLQARAREARYALLAACAEELGADIVTGHTLDDQAETFLLRLARGSGLAGLAGMAPETFLGGEVRLLRPLLGMGRAELRAYLKTRGLAWVDDPSNGDTRFARVRARQFLESVGPEAGLTPARLAQTAAHLARAQAAINAGVADVSAVAVRPDPVGFAEIALEPLRNAPEEVSLRLLARVLTGIGGAEYGPRFDRLERLWRRLRDERPFEGATLHRCRIAGQGPGGERVLVTREARALPELPLSPGALGLWDRRHRVQLAMGAPTGLRVSALGSAGVREARALLGARPAAPRAAQASLPALWQGKCLVAVPHLGAYAQGWAREDFRARFIGLARAAVAIED